MKFRTTLILLVLVVGLICVLLFYTARQPTDSEYELDRKRVFPTHEFGDPAALERKELSALAVRLELRSDEERIVMVRDIQDARGRWRMTEPVRAEADPGEALSVLKALASLQWVHILRDKPEQPLNLSLYGLDKPRWSVGFGTSDKSWTLNIGEMTADGKGLYVMRADASEPTVHVVSSLLLQKTLKRPDDLLDKAALRFSAAKVARIRLAARNQPVTECRLDEAGWRLTEPVADRADPAVLAHLLRTLAGFRAQGYEIGTDDASLDVKFGLDDPLFMVSVFEGATERTLLLGADAAGYKTEMVHAKRAGEAPVFLLPKTTLHALQSLAGNLRSRHAVSFDDNAVNAIKIVTGDKQVRLVRNGERWTMVEPSGVTPDHSRVAAFLSSLENIVVSEWLDNPSRERLIAAGLLKPEATITVTMTGKRPCEELSLGKATPKGDLCHARRGDGGPILLIPCDLLADLAAGQLLFLSRTVMEFERSDAAGIRLARPDGTFRLAKVGDEWRLTEPESGPADAVAVDEILWMLCHLEAKEFITQEPTRPAEFGLDDPGISVAISLQSEERRRTLLIGKEHEDGMRYAMSGDGNRVFLIGRGVVDALTARLTVAEDE